MFCHYGYIQKIYNMCGSGAWKHLLSTLVVLLSYSPYFTHCCRKAINNHQNMYMLEICCMRLVKVSSYFLHLLIHGAFFKKHCHKLKIMICSCITVSLFCIPCYRFISIMCAAIPGVLKRAE